MRGTKKAVYAVFAVLVFAFASKGFAADDAMDRASQMAQRMKQQLSLTDDQAAKIQDIVNKYKPAAGTGNPSGNTPPSREDFERRRTQHQQMEQEINSVLTEQQRQQYQQLREQRRNGRRGDWQNGAQDGQGRGGHHGRGRRHGQNMFGESQGGWNQNQ